MSIGYQGYAKFGDTLVLASSVTPRKVISPIYSAAAVRQGWYDASTINHADGPIVYEADVNFDLHFSIWDFLREWAIERRNDPDTVVASPDGNRVYTYNAWCTSLSMNASPDSFVTTSVSCLSIERQTHMGSETYISNRTGASSVGDIANTYPLNTGVPNEHPVPFWLTTVLAGFDAQTDAVDWSINLTNNTTPLYACTHGDILPYAVLAGVMDATANVTFYRDGGVPDYTAEDLIVNISGRNIRLVRTILENFEDPDSGQSDTIFRTFGFKGLGSYNGPPIKMS